MIVLTGLPSELLLSAGNVKSSPGQKVLVRYHKSLTCNFFFFLRMKWYSSYRYAHLSPLSTMIIEIENVQ